MSDRPEDCLPCSEGRHGSCMDWGSATLGEVCACKKRDHQGEAKAMKLFGEHDPTGGDGYVPGAWDEVRQAFMDGHISEEAYEILRLQLNPGPDRQPLARPSTAFERPPGNVYVIPEQPDGSTLL